MRKSSFEVAKPAVFDALFEANKVGLPEVISCTTMPLVRFQMDIAGEELDFNHWTAMLPVKTERTGLWRRTREIYIKDQAQSVLLTNRGWGWGAGMSELLRGEFSQVLEAIGESKELRLSYAGKYYDNFAPLTSEETVAAFIVAASYSTQPEAMRELSRTLIESAGSIAMVNELFGQASQRQGVQVIYGGKDYLDYLTSEADDDRNIGIGLSGANRMNDNYLPHRIPTNFIQWVLPLGPYEQNQLSVA